MKENLTPFYFEGLEIGAVSVKWVRRTNTGDYWHEYFRHEGDPINKIAEIFNKHSIDSSSKIAITGQTAKNLFDLHYISETECLEKALSYYNLKPDILLSLGGETFILYTLKDGQIKNIISSSKCAAGTGEFIVQQFQRMGLTLHDGIKASYNGSIVPLATRCSVHCKSDATHKLNKGECSNSDIAKSLIHDLAGKVCRMIELAQWPSQLIVVSGGVSLNEPFISSLRSSLINKSEIKILKESPYLEAFGASLFASELPEEKKISSEKWFKKSAYTFDASKMLIEAEPFLDYRVESSKEKKVVPEDSYILGIDAGSTTTKAVLFNIKNSTIDASSYLRTHGNPITAVQICIQELIKQIDGKPINIVQTAATGSGREMVSVYMNNCLSFNEILAHARAASEEVPDVETVFEIGGQDSKYIYFLHGIPIDYAMNEGCSAGTGSFLEETVSIDMNIPFHEISARAEKSSNPIAFGERCAAFINTDIRNAFLHGSHPDDVIAGLVYSIADNYISRLVGVRAIGETVLFQGGVALNRSVALAIASRLQRKVIVPKYPELMGCIGSCLMAMDLLKKDESNKKNYILKDFANGSMEIKGTFTCRSCENICEIQKISVNDKMYPFGGLCSRYELHRHRNKKMTEGRDLVEIRNRIIFEECAQPVIDNPKGTIGLPMALTSFDLFPFYAKLIHELGYNIILSQPSKEGNKKTRSAICYPCEVMHGAIYDLMNRNVDFIFLPHIIEWDIPFEFRHSYACPSTATIPGIIRGAFPEISDKLLSPHISFAKNFLQTTVKEIENLSLMLGLKKKYASKAVKSSLEYYEMFTKRYAEACNNEFNKVLLESTVIIAGRPYITCSSEVNLALPRKIISRGFNVIPADFLPPLKNKNNPRNVWHYTQQIMEAVYYAKYYPNLYICFVSCFSCGSDVSIYHLVRQELKGQTFCYLEIDSHTAHAGFETRVGAFLDIIESRMNER